MAQIRNAKGEFAKRAVGSLLQALLYDTLETFRESANIMQQKRKRSRNEELFFRLTALIERHYREERSVMFYAARLCITPKHLSAAVKKVSGKTAGEWIDRYVILSAKMMLRNSTHTIQEISNELHFANQSFFGKYFKEHVGISPSAYRMLLTGDMQK